MLDVSVFQVLMSTRTMILAGREHNEGGKSGRIGRQVAREERRTEEASE